MRGNYTQLYVHCVWVTWDRLPMITPEIQTAVYAEIIHQCRQLKSTAIAVGGVVDHVHLLVNIPPTVCISDLHNRDFNRRLFNLLLRKKL